MPGRNWGATWASKPKGFTPETQISSAGFKDAAERIAGWRQSQGAQQGDPVLPYMQNSPQLVLACYGMLRVNAVVVPVNPMNMTIVTP